MKNYRHTTPAANIDSSLSEFSINMQNIILSRQSLYASRRFNNKYFHIPPIFVYGSCCKTQTITSDRLTPVDKVYSSYLFIVSSTFSFRMQSNVHYISIPVFLNRPTPICDSLPAYPSLSLHNPHLRSIMRFSY